MICDTLAYVLAATVIAVVFFKKEVKKAAWSVVDYVCIKLTTTPVPNSVASIVFTAVGLALTVAGSLSKGKDNSASVTTKGKSKIIVIEVCGEEYCVVVPFNRRVTKEYSAKLRFKDGTEKVYKCPRGVPFYCSPNDLSCTSITFSDGVGEVLVRDDVVPDFLSQ